MADEVAPTQPAPAEQPAPPTDVAQAASQAVAVAFNPGPATQVPIKKNPKQILREVAKSRIISARIRLSARLAEAKMYERIGSKIIKVGVKTTQQIGAHADEMGIKILGHGRIVVAGENAQQAIAECDAMISALMAAEPPCDPGAIERLMQLKLAFNKQLMDSGEIHIRADKPINNSTPGVVPGIPFPPGGSMTLTVESAPLQPQQLPPSPPPIELPPSSP